ncbi:MAG: hypothetical protein IIA00_11065 [Proteobacteria bacterium]|nr:hypothetical protein [Pseudomonadota bacterium]
MAGSKVSTSEDDVERSVEVADSPLLDSATAATKKLLARGKERGYVTYDELNAALPPEQMSSEQIEDTMAMLSEMGINVIDGEETDEPQAADDKGSKGSAVATSSFGDDVGSTDDPVRLYLREMGSVELLSREGEIVIAKRIEAGRNAMISGICESPLTVAAITRWAEAVSAGKMLLRDIIDLDASYGGPGSKNEEAAAGAGDGARTQAQAAGEAAAGAPLLKLAPSSTVTLLGDLKVSAQERGAGIFSVIINYLWRTWLLGNLVQWAPRGIILPLHRLRGVKMGKGCFIDPSAIVETAYPENITLGDDVRITARVVIMTHIKAPHYLRNTGIMPAVVKPVVLKDQCFIGVNSVIMPGVTVGKAAVVASGSVVVSNVSPYTMVAGNPAKLVKRFPNPEPERVSDEQRRV